MPQPDRPCDRKPQYLLLAEAERTDTGRNARFAPEAPAPCLSTLTA